MREEEERRRGRGGGGIWWIAGAETTERSVTYTDARYPGGCSTDDDLLDLRSRGNVENGYDDDDADNENDEYYAGTVLMLGNEVTGIDADILPTLDAIVEIPMFGTKNSLNVAACGPILMYEVLRQWGALSPRGK